MKKFYVINNSDTLGMFNGAARAVDIVPMNELSRCPRNAILVEAPDEEASANEANANALRRAALLPLVCVSGLAAGVRQERIGALCKLAAIDGIDPGDPDAARQIDEAVSAALSEVPELRSAAPTAGAQSARTTTAAEQRSAANVDKRQIAEAMRRQSANRNRGGASDEDAFAKGFRS